VPEIADDGEIITVAIQRLHAGRQLEVAPWFLDEELLGESVAEAQKDEPLRRRPGGLREGLQLREKESRAGSSEKLTSIVFHGCRLSGGESYLEVKVG
jgi:hypothetical protein